MLYNEDEVAAKLQKVSNLCALLKVKIRTVESCTGGLLASTLTDINGASKFFDRGLVTYNNQAKSELLNIDINLINRYGPVSQEIAMLMAKNFLSSPDYLIVSVTGILGPQSDEFNVPIGTIYIGVNYRGENLEVHKLKLNGSRLENKNKIIYNGLDLIVTTLQNAAKNN